MKKLKFLSSLLWLFVAYLYVFNISMLAQNDSIAAKVVFWLCSAYVFILVFNNLNSNEQHGGWERLMHQLEGFKYKLEKQKRQRVVNKENQSLIGVMIYHSPKTATIRSTIAAKYNPETNEICFAVSRCSKSEQFCRRIGRNIAIARLNAGECIQSVKPQCDDTVQWTFVSVARNLATWLETNPKPIVNS